ncbi:MAG: hypothetical protein ACPHER_10280 [Nevskiales bacterium]
MKALTASLLFCLSLSSGCALVPSGDERIEKPIDDTYRPLEGNEVNHNYFETLDELRAYRDAKQAFEQEYEPEPGTLGSKPSVPEDRIQEPDPRVHSQASQPTYEEDEKRLRISE